MESIECHGPCFKKTRNYKHFCTIDLKQIFQVTQSDIYKETIDTIDRIKYYYKIENLNEYNILFIRAYIPECLLIGFGVHIPFHKEKQKDFINYLLLKNGM